VIRVRHWQNTINQMPIEADHWTLAGKTLADMAQPGALGCWYDGEKVLPQDFANVTPRDTADVTFVYTHQDDSFFQIGSILTGNFFAIALEFAIGSQVRAFVMDTLTGFLLPELPTIGGTTGASPAYGSERPTSSTENGSIVPICYGIVQTGGAVLLTHARAQSGGGSLTYRMVIGLAHGPITAICPGPDEITTDVDNLTGSAIPPGMFFGEVEARNLKNVLVSVRMGKANQTIPAGFERPYVGYEYTQRLNRGIIFKHETRREVDELEVLLSFPRGLSSLNSKDGSIASFSITVQARVYTLGGSLVTSRDFRIVSRKRENMFYSLNISGLALGKYRLEVERTVVGGSGNLNSDENEVRRVYDCEVSQVYESDSYGPAYRGVACLYIDAQASEQLQSVPTVRTLIAGKPVYDPRESTVAITGATNATPIVLTSNAHTISPGNIIRVMNVGGNTAANEEWEVGAVTANTLELVGSRGSGAYTSGGVISVYSFSTNHALITADLMANTEYGMGRRTPFDTIDKLSLSDAADWCEEDVPEVTGSATMERRFRCDVVIDSRRSGWELVVELARNARLIIVRYGNQLEYIIEEARGSNQSLEMSKGNTTGSGPSVTYSALSTRPNQITLSYQDEVTYEQKRLFARLDEPSFSDGAEVLEINRLGCTRRTEALRAAFFALRKATMVGNFCTMDTGLDALAIRPGDIVTTSRRANRVFSGRIVSGTGTTRVLDQSISFDANRAYEYTERIDDGTVSMTEFTSPGATSLRTLTTSTVPSFPGGSPVGRLFIIREFGRTKEQFMITSITNIGGMQKRLQGELYPGTLVYNDDTGPDANGVITPTPTPQPVDVTGAAVVVERVSVDRGVSEFDLSWDAAANAHTYRVYARSVTGNTAFALLATVTGLIATVRFSGAFGDLVEFGIVAVSTRGAANTADSLSAGARVSYTVMRDDENGIIAEVPPAPTGLTLSGFTGTEATFEWGASAGADGYIVYLNIWQHGKQIADTTDTFVEIRGNDRVLGIGVKAYIEKTNADGLPVRYYSTGDTRLPTERVVPSGYSDVPAVFQNEFVSVGLRNGSMIRYYSGTSNRGLLQSDPRTTFVYRLPVEDASPVDQVSGSHFISVDARPFPWLRRAPDDTSWAHPQYGTEGALNRIYFDWRVFLVYGDSGTAGTESSEGSISSATRLDVTDLLQTDIIVTGRFFTLEFVGMLRDDIPQAEGEVLIALERLAFAANPVA